MKQTAENEYMRFFVYSTEQMKMRRSIENKLGRPFQFGTIIIGGQQKKFTEMMKDIDNCRYSDVEIIAYGDIRTMKYTLPE